MKHSSQDRPSSSHSPAAQRELRPSGGNLSEQYAFSPRQLTQRRQLNETLAVPVQRAEHLQGEASHNATHAHAEPAQRQENRTGMPDDLKAGVEALSGMDLSDVRVHRNSGRPAQLNAHAYAQGNDIHLAPGQDQHLPHEAWHVVQQRQGRVQPTMELSGVSVNDDVGLEAEADTMGERATAQRATGARIGVPANQQAPVDGSSATPAQAHGLGTLSAPSLQARSASPGTRAGACVQLAKVKSAAGEFSAEPYKQQVTKFMGSGISAMAEVGAHIDLQFMPNPLHSSASKPIGMSQTTRQERTEITRAEQYSDDKTKLGRMLADGTHIDQSSFAGPGGKLLTDDQARGRGDVVRQTNPVFHSTNQSEQVADTLTQSATPNEYGRSYDPKTREPARLVDYPGRLLLPGETLTHTFETTALTLREPYQYLGSVSWGYRAQYFHPSGKGHGEVKVDMVPEAIRLVSPGDPSDAFVNAARQWNQQDFGVDAPRPVKLPIPDPHISEIRRFWLTLALESALDFNREKKRGGLVACFKDKRSFAAPGSMMVTLTQQRLTKLRTTPASEEATLNFIWAHQDLLTEAILHFYDNVPGGLGGADWGEPTSAAVDERERMEEVD